MMSSSGESWPRLFLPVLFGCALATTSAAARTARFGVETVLPDDPRTHYSRAVNFAPANGEACSLNPPRFRWQYHPTVPGEGGDFAFTFQIATDAAFARKVVNVRTEFNFYNTLKPLPGTGPFYWRIGYRERRTQGPPTRWSRVRTFTLTPEAEVWDRSSLAAPDFTSKGHPRILFTARTLPKLRNLVRSDPETQVIFSKRIRRDADRALQSKWWNRIPVSDRQPATEEYLAIARGLTIVAFCWRVTGDDKYAGVKERAVRMARYPKGGRASPERAGGESGADSTQITEFLGLLYDWLYQDLSDDERQDFVHSLDWRIDHFVNNFAWRRPSGGRLVVRGGSLSIEGESHSLEGFFDTLCAAVAVYEDSAHARECFHLGVNYLVGVGSSHGFDEGWNEGPGYGNSKLRWLVHAMCYLDSVFPEFQVGKNPWLRRLGEFFRLQTPVGLKHAPWGHGSNRSGYYENGHSWNYRKLAFLTGDGRFLANWRHYGRIGKFMGRPWIECALPLWRTQPKPVVAEKAVRLFSRAGWVMAMSGPPSDPKTYERGVGMIFCCRPRGDYSHSFCSENSFHLFAYGQDLSHAAGTSAYGPYPYHSMSHNTILVDGLGQAQTPKLQKIPYYGRILAFGQSEGTTYWCGDATKSYPRESFRPRDWWGKLSDIYERRNLAHLTRAHRHVLFVRNKYFVILDDLAASRDAQWTWLYHVLAAETFDLDRETGSFQYTMGDVRMHVSHLLGAGRLDVQDLQGKDGFRNPLTAEDYTNTRGSAGGKGSMIAQHNLWLTTREKHPAWRFLTVLYPVPPGGRKPIVERLDELTLRVRSGAETDVITFDPSSRNGANIVVDLRAIAGTSGYRQPRARKPQVKKKAPSWTAISRKRRVALDGPPPSTKHLDALERAGRQARAGQLAVAADAYRKIAAALPRGAVRMAMELRAEGAGLQEELVQVVVKSFKDTGPQHVYINFAGRTERARLTGATESLATFSVRGSPFPMPWERLSPQRLGAIAAKYSTSAVELFAVAKYLAACGEPAAARRLLEKARDAGLTGNEFKLVQALESSLHKSP